MFTDAYKTARMLAFLEEEHFRHRRLADDAASADEIDLSAGWSLTVDARPSALLTHMRDDFRAFMSRCMDTDLATGDCGRRLTFRLDDCASREDESFRITVCDDRVDVESAGERGLLHASHYLERQFALRGGPFLKKGVTAKAPAFDLRISNTVFCADATNMDDAIVLTPRYMGLMSHFGVNGVHVYVRLWDYCKNSSLPELNAPDYDRNIDQLRNLCVRAGEHGIDIYLTVRNEYFPADAPVFQKHPAARGALVNYPIPGDKYCLCSSNPDVIACYRESFANLFERVPELGGAILIIGGEGFIHCFTRPKPPLKGKTSCPNCSDHNPSRDVADLMNGIASSIHSVNPEAKVMSWPYSAFIWSGEDTAQTEFIAGLNDDVNLMSTFETPGTFTLGGRSAAMLDYNIVDLGPSEQFKTQSRVLEERGKSHYAKFESSVEPGWFFLPYLPLHYRWIERVKRLKEHGVPGFIARWRFYGFTDCIPEEIISESIWDENIDPDALLMSIARRDFGKVDGGILEGWKRLSTLWEKIPSGHMIWGERDFYMKGPIYLGPAHPLIFDSQKRYDLGRKFFTMKAELIEMCSPEEQVMMERNAPPRYSSDLLFTYPFGAEAVEEAFRSALEEWNAATDLIAQAMGPTPNTRARMELNICRIVGAHLRTAWNVARFYRERDSLFTQPGDEAAFLTRIERLTAIADDEIENAKDALRIIEDDVRIGYGYCYGQIYDADMVREKRRQCIYVRDTEIPEFRSGLLFHVYQKYIPALSRPKSKSS